MSGSLSPRDRAKAYYDALEKDSRASIPKGEIKTVLNTIIQAPEGAPELVSDDTCRAPIKVNELRRGDVFIAKLIGGKVRPWVVLAVRDGLVSCLTLSSGDSAPRMTQSQCRLWPGSWLGSTISIFDLEFASKEVTRPYTNLRHLAEVEAKVADLHGMKIQPTKAVTMQEIAARFKGAA